MFNSLVNITFTCQQLELIYRGETSSSSVDNKYLSNTQSLTQEKSFTFFSFQLPICKAGQMVAILHLI